MAKYCLIKGESIINRREFLKRLAIVGGSFGLLDNIFNYNVLQAYSPSMEPGYHRIVVLGDPHYPTRPKNFGLSIANNIVDAKHNAIKDINSWNDTELVAVVGDIVSSGGTEEEYAQATKLISSIQKPVAPIAGNHDFIYQDEIDENFKRHRGTPEQRQMKLDRFRDAYGLDNVYYTRQIGGYLLIFLSPDKTDSEYLCEISYKQYQWLIDTLQANSKTPTLIFFHAPLMGTLENYNRDANRPSFVAQPEIEIDELINANPQIILWVSGHTHTPATNPSFNSPINLYKNKVWNIHNSDMDRTTIWTNSLYLYPDKVVIETFNHKEGQFMEQMHRVISSDLSKRI